MTQIPTIDMSRLDITKQNVAVERVFRLDSADVLTAEQSGQLLAPYIKPLPLFDDSLLPS